jgi:hypothetical protein
MAETITLQAGRFTASSAMLVRRAGTVAINHGAQRLAALARGAARARSSTHAAGRDIVQSIKVQRASAQAWPISAKVFIDPNDEKGRIATYVHENYSGYTIRPKVKKFLFIPLTAAGRRHELYAEDALQKRLKGWIGGVQRRRTTTGKYKKGFAAGATGSQFGYWGDDNASAPLDFVLKREAHIPPNPRAGFLTRTAVAASAQISALMQSVFNLELTRRA